ncbi:MAG: sugar ABC transporter ATP-binding protein [Clostridiales Family XIII bacterium]|jgi:ABC-type sugar transport system ATPase subunit|nr:sugar ABC transporter ATP-binding protein [Clostridiales Family XIII bacterium]
MGTANDCWLDLQGISKYFPGVHALDKVKFDLRKGEVHALVGENGAGKSTLIKIIAGIYHGFDGQMRFENEVVTFRNPNEAINKGISVIYQELNLVPNMSIAENIYFSHLPTYRAGIVNKKKVYEDTKILLDYIGLSEDPRTLLKKLPVAKQQLVEIAKAISLDTKVIIMDEPTSALSPSEIDNLFRIIKDLKAKGCGIIYVSHKLEEILKATDRITVLRDGKYVDTINTSDATQQQIISLMVGRELSDLYPKQGGSIGDVMLDVQGLTSYHVKDISFNVRSGEIVGFSGLMGAGRTELTRAIIGSDKRLVGKVIVDGIELKRNDTRESKQAGIGYVPENRKEQGIFGDASIKFNMTISTIKNFVRFNGIKRRKELTSVNDMVNRLGIKTPSVTQLIQKLSGGNQQKVILARSLIKEDLKVLIVDEPTRGIDIGAKAEIYTILDQLTRRGIAVIIVSSEMPEILTMCDRIYVMKRGRINAEINNEDATQELLLQSAI